MISESVPQDTAIDRLRRENEELLRRSSETSDDHEAALAFIAHVAASGAELADKRARRAAQAIINFWTAELISRASVPQGWTPPPLSAANSVEKAYTRPGLEAMRKALPQSASSDQILAEAADTVRDPELQRVRQLVQIGAMARRWKESGYDAGWLLGGDALEEAANFAEQDPDIQMLVQASLANESQKRKQNRWIVVFVLTLTAALITLSSFYYQNTKVIAELEVTEKRLSDNYETLEQRQAESNRQAAENAELVRQLSDAREQQRALDRERQQQLDEAQAAAFSAAAVARTAVDLGRSTDEDIPAALQSFVSDLAPVSLPLLPFEPALVAGYDPMFLQESSRGGAPEMGPAVLVVPMPGPRASTLPYVNFSIAMADDRRMALVAAANIRRSGLVALRRPNAVFQPDERITPESQPALQWFRQNDLDLGHLVSARDVAWGPGFPADAVEAGRRAYGMTAALTNATPQYDTFNRGVWGLAEQYARAGFAPAADRVTVFSGPLLEPNDPQHADGARVPRAFWKLLVAADPGDPTTLIVEAYVIPQVGPDGAKVSQQERFDRATLRVTVDRLESLTGLDFGDVVRAADLPFRIASGTAPPPTDVAAVIAGLDVVKGPDAGARRAAMQRLLDVIRDPRVTEDARARLVEAIVGMMGDASFKALSPPARVNAATLLATVPKEFWDRDDRIDLKATARRAVGDAGATLGGCRDGKGDACTQLANARQRLDWAVASKRTVYVQFAGMAREDVKTLSAKLSMLGWQLPGEERTSKAANVNEIRHADAPEDKRAADLLAADYRALGQTIRKVVKVDDVRQGFTEVWLSKLPETARDWSAP